ncbi:hypothetical protein WDW37_19635 [Bdellovibrionota bacterium FG-1]
MQRSLSLPPLFATMACITAFGFLGSSAHADILFIDLNDSPAEIKEATTSVLARHEKLFVFPQYTKEEKVNIRKSLAMVESLRGALEDPVNQKFPAKLEKIQIQLNTAAQEYRRVFHGGFNLKKLDEYLALLEKEKSSVSALVLSSHSAGGEFWGKFATSHVSLGELFEVIDRHPSIKNDLRTAILLACYSGTHEYLAEWNRHFPEMKIIFGFDGPGPGSEYPYSYRLLGNLLLQQERLFLVKNGEEAAKAMANIPYARATETSALFNHIWVTRDGFQGEFKDDEQDCSPQDLERIKNEKHVFQKYFEASGTDDVPVNEFSSDLRSYYNHLQKGSYCTLPSDTPPLAVVGALIHFRNLRHSFAIAFQEKAQQAKEALLREGKEQATPWVDLAAPTTTRRMVLDEILNFRRLIKGSETLEVVRDYVEWMDAVLGRMDCVPRSWITFNDPWPQVPAKCD